MFELLLSTKTKVIFIIISPLKVFTKMFYTKRILSTYIFLKIHFADKFKCGYQMGAHISTAFPFRCDYYEAGNSQS